MLQTFIMLVTIIAKVLLILLWEGITSDEVFFFQMQSDVRSDIYTKISFF
jgi:hypothetical protein